MDRMIDRLTRCPGPIPGLDLSEPLRHGCGLLAGTGGHVRVDQRVDEAGRGWLEFTEQVGGKTSFLRFDHGARMGYQAAKQGVGVLDVAQVAGRRADGSRCRLGAPCRTFTDAAAPSWDVYGTSRLDH